MKNSTLYFISVFTMFLFSNISYAQNGNILQGKDASKLIPGAEKIALNRNSMPRMIEFTSNSVLAKTVMQDVHRYLKMENHSLFLPTRSEGDETGASHKRFKQHYKNIEIEGAEFIIHEKDGYVQYANGRIVNDQHIRLDVKPSLTEAKALAISLSATASKAEDVKGKSKLVITSKNFAYSPGSFHLVYQFEINGSVENNWLISIDAHTGEVINKVSLTASCFESSMYLPYANGSGQTVYYGSKNIKTEEVNGSYRLHGETSSGGLIATYNLNGSQSYNEAVDFEDADNNFTDATAQAGVTVQWGTEKTYEYFFLQHGRNSYDNLGSVMSSYVHYGNNVFNAISNGPTTYYGDGDGTTGPVVSLDIVGHEWTHSVTRYSSNLIYENESGALNESFSDIFGKAIDFYAREGDASWELASELYGGTSSIRSMSNPNLRNQPDTYFGNYWFFGSADAGGVHTNSGVQNYWFYLLCNGGNGTNDMGFAYLVPAIGIEKAARIAYRNLIYYMGETSEYIDSRFGSLQAATDIFGANSPERQAVEAAWDAVGVRDEPLLSNLRATEITGTSVNLNIEVRPNQTITNVRFEYGLSTAYGSTTSSVPVDAASSTSDIKIPVTGLDPQTLYYFRAVATNASGSTELAGTFSTVSQLPLVTIQKAVNVGSTAATLQGLVNPNSLNTTYHFEYGLTPQLEQSTTIQNLPASVSSQQVTILLQGLESYKQYYFRISATNSAGTSFSNTDTFFTYDRPIISMIAPAKARPGDAITIQGLNFNPEPAKNAIYFGAVVGSVITGNASSLTVQVPSGASFGPVSLTNQDAGLTAFSKQDFTPIFDGGGFYPSPIQLKFTADGGYEPSRTSFCDLDLDGKPDMVLFSEGSGVTILRNAHGSGSLTPSSFTNSGAYGARFYGGMLSDIDGDGKKDIVMLTGSGFAVFPNRSTPGHIIFSPPVEIALSKETRPALTVADFDNSGTPDIAIQNFTDRSLVIFRNDNPKGVISSENFSIAASLPINSLGLTFIAEDIDANGKIDILVGRDNGNQFIIFENTTIDQNSLSFNALYITSAPAVHRFCIADLNNDGRKDILTLGYTSGGSVIYHANESIEGQIRLSNVFIDATLEALENGRDIQLADMNGDGQLELIRGTTASAFRIYTMGDNALFTSIGDYDSGNGFYAYRRLAVNDLNADSKPDIINLIGNGSIIEVYENTGMPCPSPNALTVTDFTGNSVLVRWTGPADIGSYTLEFSKSGENNWTAITVNGTEYTLPNLDPAALYDVRVRSNCNVEYSAWQTLASISSCPSVTGLTAQPGVSSMMLNWNGIIGATGYTIFYKQSSATNWSSQTTQQTSLQINGLLPGTSYEFSAQTTCEVGSSNWSIPLVASSTICPVPSNLTVNSLSLYNVNISWTKAPEISQHKVWIRPSGGTWSSFVTTTDNVSQSITPGLSYEVYVQSLCTSYNSSSEVLYFTAPNYCPSRGLNTQYEWIDFIGVGTLNHASGNDGGYANNTNLIPSDFQQGYFYTIQLSVGSGYPNAWSRYFSVWIDFNRDGDFSDYGERIVNTSTTTLSNVAANFTIPLAAQTGYTRMRVSMQYGANPSECLTFSYGEVEDYLVNIIDQSGGSEFREDQGVVYNSKPEQSIQPVMEIYPNPVSDKLYVQIFHEDSADALLSIIDLTGKTVWRGGYRRDIDVSNLQVGLYILLVDTGHTVKQVRFMKQ